MKNKIKVLDKGWIELQDVMGDDLAIVNAARTSFLGESKGEQADKKLLFYLMENMHTSPFEMVEFKIRIHAPLLVFWQLVRHRTFSINMSSGRYTEFDEKEVYIPKEWRLQSKSNKQGSDGTLDSLKSVGMTNALISHYERSYTLYKTALEMGVAKEQARLFLAGFAVYYTGVIKVDAHNLMHFLQLRMDSHAQYEIQEYAKAIYENFFKPTLPWCSEAFEKYRLNK